MRRRIFLGAFLAGCTGGREPEDPDGFVGLHPSHAAGDDAPRTVRSGDLRTRMQSVSVTMYMTAWCPYCRRAQAWLDERGYRYVMRNVDADEEAADILADINPRGAVPTFEIDGQVVRGFHPRSLEAAIRRAALQ